MSLITTAAAAAAALAALALAAATAAAAAVRTTSRVHNDYCAKIKNWSTTCSSMLSNTDAGVVPLFQRDHVFYPFTLGLSSFPFTKIFSSYSRDFNQVQMASIS